MKTIYMAFVTGPDAVLPMMTIEDEFLHGDTEEEVIEELRQYYGHNIPSIIKVYKCSEVI